jgi:hypothetical protein
MPSSCGFTWGIRHDRPSGWRTSQLRHIRGGLRADAAPAEQKTAPISFCSVFGGELPVIGRLPYCKKKVPEKMEVPPVSVPTERKFATTAANGNP